MRLQYRLLPHGSQGKVTSKGGQYQNSPGTVLDVFADTTDIQLLTSNGWTRVALSGATANRPDPSVVPLALGTPFVDTTLGKVVIWDGVNWRDPFSGAIV